MFFLFQKDVSVIFKFIMDKAAAFKTLLHRSLLLENVKLMSVMYILLYCTHTAALVKRP